MADNFIDTAERMRDSSNILHAQNDYHNACYLAGYVVECYLKIFMNFSLPHAGATARHYGHDINRLSTDLAYAATSSASASAYKSYILDTQVECPGISSSWSPYHRYQGNPSPWNDIMSQNFTVEKEKCFEMLTKMIVDNII